MQGFLLAESCGDLNGELLPPETDKVWLHTGVIVCGYDIQSDPRESEKITLRCY